MVVGLPESSRSRAKAQAEGLTVLTPAAAADQSDIVMVLTPDTSQAALYRDELAPHLRAGNTLMFAHGFNIRFGAIDPARDSIGAMGRRPRDHRERAGSPCAVLSSNRYPVVAASIATGM